MKKYFVFLLLLTLLSEARTTYPYFDGFYLGYGVSRFQNVNDGQFSIPTNSRITTVNSLFNINKNLFLNVKKVMGKYLAHIFSFEGSIFQNNQTDPFGVLDDSNNIIFNVNSEYKLNLFSYSLEFRYSIAFLTFGIGTGILTREESGSNNIEATEYENQVFQYQYSLGFNIDVLSTKDYKLYFFIERKESYLLFEHIEEQFLNYNLKRSTNSIGIYYEFL